jgi:hypothetical protein
MTVQELIDKLREFDPSQKVFVALDGDVDVLEINDVDEVDNAVVIEV